MKNRQAQRSETLCNGPQTLKERILSRTSLLTLEDLAELFNFSYRKAWEMASQGKVPAMQIGSAWRIDPVLLARWLDGQMMPSAGTVFPTAPTGDRAVPEDGAGSPERWGSSSRRGPIGRTLAARRRIVSRRKENAP